jgi:hypothetical protein
MNTNKGLILEIYRSDYDCRINKMNGKKSVVLVDNNIPEIFTADNEMPAVKIVKRHLFGSDYIHAEPIEPGYYAFGGTYIHTSDSRVREIATYPIPLHDRQMNLE